jgi:hypothetical protein
MGTLLPLEVRLPVFFDRDQVLRPSARLIRRAIDILLAQFTLHEFAQRVELHRMPQVTAVLLLFLATFGKRPLQFLLLARRAVKISRIKQPSADLIFMFASELYKDYPGPGANAAGTIFQIHVNLDFQKTELWPVGLLVVQFPACPASHILAIGACSYRIYGLCSSPMEP